MKHNRCCRPDLNSGSCRISNKGFTLLEVLVVVIIIAVLAAIAVPQYKHAVLKSRFSAVMPLAKSVADAQEVYYLGKGYYAQEDEKDQLDVTPVNAENTTVILSQTDGYDYVMAQNSQVPGANYIIYQKNSENYPSEIHCEAADDNEDAQWLCGVLSNNNSIGKTVTDGYTTYIMKGTGAGLPVGAGSDSGGVSCSAAEAMGLSCNITTNEAGEQVKQVCVNGFCRTKTYDEDGGYTSVTCSANSEGVCTSNWKSKTYDANGNVLAERVCSTMDSNGNCKWCDASYTHDYTYDVNGNRLTERRCANSSCGRVCTNYQNSGADYTYDANGNMLTRRACFQTRISDGVCTYYNTSSGDNYTYDANGNMLTARRCSSVDGDTGDCTAYNTQYSYDYVYDANGNKLSERQCSSFDSSGNCTAYSYVNDYTYDANGNKLTERFCYRFDNSTGKCSSSYSSGYDYTYDANGNILTQRNCFSVDSNGSCTYYQGYKSYDFTYDANGNKLTERQCSSFDSSGNCTAYSSSGNYDYTRDANGNELTRRQCSSFDSSGNCTAYSSSGNYDFTRDANGKTTSSRTCQTVASDGTCSAYSFAGYYTYDDNGKQIAYQYCSGDNINISTGECIAYNSTTVQSN